MSDSPILAELEVAQNGKGVRAEFTKLDGVISHTIYLVNNDEKSPALISRINEPGLPCFSELHQQGDTLFLTGVEGPCHWSMCVERGECRWTSKSTLRESFDFRSRLGLNRPKLGDWPDARLLFFDVACRLSEAVTDCRSGYLLQQGSDFEVQIGEGCGILRLTANQFLLIGNNTHPENQKFSREPRSAIAMTSNEGLRISTVEDQLTIFPTSVRWSYAVWRL